MKEQEVVSEYQRYAEFVLRGYMKDMTDVLSRYMIPRQPINWRTRLRWWCIRWLIFGWFKDWLHKDCDR